MKKKSLSVMIAVLVLLSALSGVSASAYSKRMKGDLDGDNEITASDARIVLRFSVNLEKLSTTKKKNADMDGNGSVDASDARLILRISVGFSKYSNEYEVLKSGSFYVKGSISDETGKKTPIELAVDGEKIYMLSIMDGEPMGIIISDDLYMVCPNIKSYLVIDDVLLKLMGYSKEEIVGDGFVDFSEFEALSDADSVKNEIYEGRNCKVYSFNINDNGEKKIYMDGNKLVCLADYNNGKIVSSYDFEIVTEDIPAGKLTPPSEYKRYSGLKGAMDFMELLENK